MSTIEEKVHSYLKTNGISHRFFANLIGISSSNLSEMFKGKRKMKATELIRFCEKYNLNLDFFKENTSDSEVVNG